MSDLTARLRDIASKATEGPWVEAHAAISGRVLRLSPTGPTKVAECDPFLDDAGFIATFDPVTVDAMLDVIDAAEDHALLCCQCCAGLQGIDETLARFREVAG